MSTNNVNQLWDEAIPLIPTYPNFSSKLTPMQQVTLRLDADVIAWFKQHSEMQQGKGYQTTINRALRAYVAQQTSKE